MKNILIIMLCSRPYIRLLYGKQVRSLENQLQALNQDSPHVEEEGKIKT